MAAPARTGLVLLAALTLAGCASSLDPGIERGGKLGGKTLTVYSLTPDPDGASSDRVDGEKLALSDARGRIHGLIVNFASLDLGDTDATAAEATRRAIEDPQIIAAVVDATPVTVPLLNAAGILQIAPGGDQRLSADADANPSGHRTLGPIAALAVPAGFDRRFQAKFGRTPSAQARTGYRAMRGVLRAITRAGRRGNDRTRVIDAYFSPRASRPA